MEKPMKVCIFEDSSWKNFLPLTYTRAVFDLRCGIYSHKTRIFNHYKNSQKSFLVREELEDLYKERYQDIKVNEFDEGQFLFICGSLIYSGDVHTVLHTLRVGEGLFNNDTLIAAKIHFKKPKKFSVNDLDKITVDLKKIETDITCNEYTWQLVERNHQQLIYDFADFTNGKTNFLLQDGSFHVINPDNIFIEKDVTLEPGVVLDARLGPIVLDEKSHIMANSVLKGPVYIGKNSRINVSAKIYEGTNIGKVCKVGGEVEETIFQSYANKQHDGFLGHSYVGEWVNIGADTNNSNLKNNYQPVKAYFYPTRNFKNTEMQFFGSVFGDHTKTGINVTINTGTIIGVGCNIYSPALFSGLIPCFSMGTADHLGDLHLHKMMETAEIVKKRRNLKLTTAERSLLQKCYDESSHLRKIFHKVKR